jgi:hypothetical protein
MQGRSVSAIYEALRHEGPTWVYCVQRWNKHHRAHLQCVIYFETYLNRSLKLYSNSCEKESWA